MIPEDWQDRLREAAESELRWRRGQDRDRHATDIAAWAGREFLIPETSRPIQLQPQQVGVLRYAFSRLRPDDPRIAHFPSLAGRVGHFPFAEVLYSTPRKGGKTTIGAVVARYMAEVQTRFGEIYCMGNDLEQAKGREFKFISDSIRLNPATVYKGGDWVLPGRWQLQRMQLTCLSSGTIVRPLSVDAPGEAGANPDLTCWTELWGFALENAMRFWVEVGPVPTKVDSIRLVETSAGFEGESKLLEGQYTLGKSGRQLTAGELSAATGVPLDAFEETGGDAEAPVPIWVHEGARLFMYWDDGEVARRMPWMRGVDGETYYRVQEQSKPPHQFRRQDLNKWTGSESEFVPIAMWDACKDEVGPEPGQLPPFQPGDKTPCVVGVDAATTADCFGIVAVTRMPGNSKDVAVRAVRVWTPPKGGAIDYTGPEAFLRTICKGGCAMGHPQTLAFRRDDCPACRDGALIPGYNVMCIVYDSSQLVYMMQGLRNDSVAWCEEFDQRASRLKADRGLFEMVINRQLHHDGNQALRGHMQNAKARLQTQEDSTMRIIKKAPDRKVDLVVALSMAAYQCRYLLLD